MDIWLPLDVSHSYFIWSSWPHQIFRPFKLEWDCTNRSWLHWLSNVTWSCLLGFIYLFSFHYDDVPLIYWNTRISAIFYTQKIIILITPLYNFSSTVCLKLHVVGKEIKFSTHMVTHILIKQTEQITYIYISSYTPNFSKIKKEAIAYGSQIT